MSEQIPAGWYPDPKDTASDPRPQRWWDGRGWTASTRPAPSDAPTPEPPAAAPSGAFGAPEPGTAEQPRVLEGEVLESGPTVRYPEPPPFGAAWGDPGAAPRKPRRKPSKLVIATVAAALLGLGAGSGITYLAMDGHGKDHAQRAARSVPGGENGPWGDLPGFGDGPGTDGKGGGNGNNNGNGNGGGKSKPGPGTAVDVVNRLSLPVPSGWKGSHTAEGYAAMYVGSYTCADGQSECTLGGVNTGRIDGGGSDVAAAAKADIDKAAKDSYADVTGHQELKNEAVKVNGQDGWLIRWKVDAAKGNNGYVQTVVFPSSDGKTLVSVHFGFDIADKAPDVSLMDTIVKGITDYKGKLPSLPGGGSATPDGGVGGTST
ncbi:hypothetical protein VM98_13985 [Streptomyces rubellomurinus subsp. indigoferus]|nr:hypothetical protein VM98_13985 [Streptomyces rubellomurinus subsp. indigoferus]